MSPRIIRIGCSSAFWGDAPDAARQLILQGGKLDYLVSDYLAEITMCILARSKKKYVAEFVETVWKPLMKYIVDKGIKIVTNAGGMDPVGLKEEIERVSKEAGLNPMPVVAAVTGDDLMDRIDDIRTRVQPFGVVAGESEPLWGDNPVMSCNAYLGAVPIAKCLQDGAHIVVAGRIVDSALVLGPLLHEFGWSFSDYDKLASGSLAGHIIECGAHATGGNYTDWRESYAQGWDNVGFPIAECYSDGSFVITKPGNTGGIVTRGTVAEQMLYEIADPGAYVLPDVVCDWRNVKITEEPSSRQGNPSNRGAKGLPPTRFYKIGVTTLDGYRMSGSLLIGGAEAAAKAQAVGESILARTRRVLKEKRLGDFVDTNIEILGSEHTYGPHSRMKNSREVLLRMAVHHRNERALNLFARELAPSATSMAPGITGGDGGRPKPSPVLRYYSCLIPKEEVPVSCTVGKSAPQTSLYLAPSDATAAIPVPPALPPDRDAYVGSSKTIRVPLIALCYGRSGDKGDSANIGLIARRPEYFPFLKKYITEEYMKHLVQGRVKRFELPGICALNFVLTQALGGGGVASLRVDRQGKAYAQMLLTMEVDVPQEWAKYMPPQSKL